MANNKSTKVGGYLISTEAYFRSSEEAFQYIRKQDECVDVINLKITPVKPESAATMQAIKRLNSHRRIRSVILPDPESENSLEEVNKDE